MTQLTIARLGEYLRVELPNLGPVLLRPIRAGDEPFLVEGLARLSPDASVQRFHSGMSRYTADQLRYLTDVDQIDHGAWGAAASEDPATGMGLGRYLRLPDEPTVAELAVTVLEPYRRCGLATVLLGVLWSQAARHGIESFRAWVRGDNDGARRLLQNLGAIGRPAWTGVLQIDLPLDLVRLADSPASARLRSVIAQLPPS